MNPQIMGFATGLLLARGRGVKSTNARNRAGLLLGAVGLSPVGVVVANAEIQRDLASQNAAEPAQGLPAPDRFAGAQNLAGALDAALEARNEARQARDDAREAVNAAKEAKAAATKTDKAIAGIEARIEVGFKQIEDRLSALSKRGT